MRKALFEEAGYDVNTKLEELDGKTIGEVLLEPTRIYVKALKPLFEKHLIKGVAHITGGGFIENIPRMYSNNLAAKINTNSWSIPPIFNVIEKAGNVDHTEMFNVFNMGIGMVLAVDESKAEEALSTLSENNETAYVIGKMIERENAAVELQ